VTDVKRATCEGGSRRSKRVGERLNGRRLQTERGEPAVHPIVPGAAEILDIASRMSDQPSFLADPSEDPGTFGVLSSHCLYR